MPLCSTTVVQRVAVLAEILGDPLGQKGVHFRSNFGRAPPFLRNPRSRSGQKFQKTATSGLVAYQKKGVHFRSTLFVVGFIFETLRSITEFFIK